MEAAAKGDWNKVKACSENILRFDPANQIAWDYMNRLVVKEVTTKQLSKGLSVTEKLIHKAARAAVRSDWATVKARTEQVLCTDPKNMTAKELWKEQERKNGY